jgi:C4-dicarboxylate transporter
MSQKRFVKVSLDTVETTATVMFIVAAASIFGWMLTATGVTAQIAEWVLAVTKEPWLFLLMANLLMLFVGCFLEPTAAITILVPILLPIAHKLGVDPVHFGLVMVLNLMIGLLAPADGHGAVRAGARGQAERRAHDDGDPAVAGAAAGQPGGPDLPAGDLVVAAAHVGVPEGAVDRGA